MTWTIPIPEAKVLVSSAAWALPLVAYSAAFPLPSNRYTFRPRFIGFAFEAGVRWREFHVQCQVKKGFLEIISHPRQLSDCLAASNQSARRFHRMQIVLCRWRIVRGFCTIFIDPSRIESVEMTTLTCLKNLSENISCVCVPRIYIPTSEKTQSSCIVFIEKLSDVLGAIPILQLDPLIYFAP